MQKRFVWSVLVELGWISNILAQDAFGHQEWGESTNGLRARAVPVMSSMSDDAIDPRRSETRFSNSDDVAFVVEIENVGDEQITLLDPLEVNGNRRSDFVAQFMFSIDIFDEAGNLIERPKVQVVDVDLFLHGLHEARIISLAPGQTHRYLLRPMKWCSSLTYRIEPGRYRAVVHYHGMPTETINRSDEGHYKRPVPDQLLAAVVGDIASLQVPFEISSDNVSSNQPDVTREEAVKPAVAGRTLGWGEPSNGLRAAMELIPWKEGYSHGEKAKVLMHLQNVSDAPITLIFELYNEPGVTVKTVDGNPIDVRSHVVKLGHAIIARTILNPQQIIILDRGSIGIESSMTRAEKFGFWPFKLILPAGQYTVQLHGYFYDLPLKDGDGGPIESTTANWTGRIATGETPLTVFDASEGRIPVPERFFMVAGIFLLLGFWLYARRRSFSRMASANNTLFPAVQRL